MPRPRSRSSFVRSQIQCVPAPRTAAIPKRKKARARIPLRDYIFPESRSYPIPDAYHATLALSFMLRTIGRHGMNPKRQERARIVLRTIRDRWPDVYACERDLVREIRREADLRRV